MTADSAALWPKLLLRLQSMAYEQARAKTFAVLTVKLILVNGELRCWAEPSCTGIEGHGKEELLELIVSEG